MTPQQFKEARHALGLSQSQLGHILGTTDRTIRKWESGDRSPNPTAVRAVEWMLDGYRPKQMDELDAMRNT